MRVKYSRISKRNNSNIFIKHISSNFNLYLVTIVLFTLGIFIGVLLVNHTSYIEKQETKQYIENILLNLKDNINISKTQVLKKDIIKNTVLLLIIWILGLSFFGKYYLYLILFSLGINFGYTIASITASLKFTQGILFIFTTFFPQNIVFLPATLFIITQGIKIYNEISNKHNIKHAIIKFTVLCLIVFILFSVSSFIEVYVSGNILNKIVKYL